MKPKKLTIVKHGDMYVEDMRCGFCPECSKLEVGFTSKDTAIRGVGLIRYTVANYKYECKNCGCIWSEDDIVKRRVNVSDNMAESFMTLLAILLVCVVVCINVIVIGAAVHFIENLLG